MSSSGDDDLDWLYGRERQQSEPERTRVMPSPPRTASQAPPQNRASYPPPSPSQYGSPPPARPAPPPATSAKRRHPVRNVFRVLLILLLLLILWLVGVPAYAWTQIARVDAAPSGQRPADQPGKTFLLVGSDSRAGLSKAEQKRLGTGSTGGQRTDTIMIVYVPPGGKPALISVPRDSYVDIPKSAKNKINAAYAFGGPQLLVQTVEQNTGLRMDGYMEIGFGGFVNIIDALGGIRMCLPKAIKDRDSHIDLPKGCQTLSGVEALGYVRMRKADPLGDLGRVQRQREMLACDRQEGRFAGHGAQPGPLLEAQHGHCRRDQIGPRHVAARGAHAGHRDETNFQRKRAHADRSGLQYRRSNPRRLGRLVGSDEVEGDVLGNRSGRHLGTGQIRQVATCCSALGLLSQVSGK